MYKMISQNISVDEIDKQIISIIQKDPTITHTDIAKRVDRSQPTIGLRIRKLEDAGLINFQAGLNLRVADVMIAQVKITTNNPEKILEKSKECPFMLNAFRLSGEDNIIILIANSTIKHLDQIVNEHFRRDPNVLKVKMDIITDVMKDFVLPLDINMEDCNCLLGIDM